MTYQGWMTLLLAILAIWVVFTVTIAGQSVHNRPRSIALSWLILALWLLLPLAAAVVAFQASGTPRWPEVSASPQPRHSDEDAHTRTAEMIAAAIRERGQ